MRSAEKKGNDTDTNRRKKYLTGSKNLIDESTDTRREWNNFKV